MKIQVIDDINNHFLVAMPKVQNDLFAKSVLYMYEHDAAGSMGFVINKPLPITLGDILRQLSIDLTSNKADQVALMQGGPVAQEQLYIIQYRDPKSRRKPKEKILLQPNDLLHSFAAGEELDNVLPFLGYSGWDDGQLEQEIKDNDWLICPADREVLFTTEAGQRWEKSIRLLGVDPSLLSSSAGHA